MVDWTESLARRAGIDPDPLARAVRLVAQRGGSAQLCVLHGDRVLIDRCFGCRPDSLFWLFSTSKPFVALLVHRLAERGLLGLDEPVARYWPEFAARGKQHVTVRHVLSHRAGLPLAHHSIAADSLAMLDGPRFVRALARARPRWAAGAVPAYHIISYGYLLGELVRRVTGRPVGAVLRDELLDPLRLGDIHLGLPAVLYRRAVPVRTRGRTLPARYWLNRSALRAAPIPAAGVSATARDVALFYRMLLRGGELDGARVLAPASVAAARAQSTADGELDRLLHVPVRWAYGFQLGSASVGSPSANPLGQTSHRDAFGHNGSNACLAWADPTRDLVFVHLGNVFTAGHEGAGYLAEVSDAVLAAVDGGRRIGGRE
ncbi:serine hydrolase domain-containing protein [Actinocatenispora sera]|uniref:serine hydrolase domain-containing protein n=1 Tax=Actinocatenispora sera TaxID=390989 RepID=UPI0033FF51BD